MNLPLTKIPLLNKRVKFPVTPHIPGGLVTPAQLCAIATVAKKYGGSLKIVGNGITILGLSLTDGEKALVELGHKPESFIAKSVRGVAMCPSKPYCPMAQQDSTNLGLTLDESFFGQEVPGKLRMGVSGCPNCCAEVFVKDIGLFGTATGYTLVVGGNAGRHARIATIMAEGLPAEAVKPVIKTILHFYRQHGKTKERLGELIQRLGRAAFIEAVVPMEYRT